MNINEEGKYYAAMVRKFRTEYKNKNQSFSRRSTMPLLNIRVCCVAWRMDVSTSPNNICVRQIRRIAKYRNNSYFVGCPKSGVRFARLMAHFANIRKHNQDPVEYLCDVFRRIKTTAKDKFVDLLEHRWQPATMGVWA